MNQCIMPRSDVWGGASSHSLMRFDPQSCSTEQQKVANLRTLVSDVEAQIKEVETLADKMEFYATGELVAAIVMETSIGFLDLAASAFSSLNPAASRAAKAGVLSIKSAETAGQAYTGQISGSAAAANLANNAVQLGFSQAKPNSMGGKVMLNKAKMAYDSAVLGVKSATGASEADMRREGIDYLAGQISDNGNLMADGLEKAGMDTASNSLKSLVVVGDMYVAAGRYQEALEKRFDARIEQMVNTQTWVMNQKMTLSTLLTTLRSRLDEAVRALESCQLATS